MKANYLVLIAALTGFTFLPTIACAESAQAKMHSGVSSYKQQKYDEARTLFSEAKEEEPQNPELNYNLANSQFKSGHFPEALQAYNQSYTTSTEPQLQQKSLYNMGNTLYHMGKFEEAIETYKRSLEIDSNDMDAKFNLEFVREQLKKKQHQKQKSDRNQNSDPSQDQEQQSGGPNPPDPHQIKPEQPKDPGNESSKDQNQISSKYEENQTSSQSINTKQTKKGAMTPREAEQWLRALRENPKLLSRMQSSQQGRNPPYLGKDW